MDLIQHFLVSLLFFSVFFGFGSNDLTTSNRRVYNSLSRGELLTVLSELKEKTQNELSGIRQLFTAKFSNNEHTNQFIYPAAHKKYSNYRDSNLTLKNYKMFLASLPPNPKFCDRTSLIQIGYGIWVNLGMVLGGTSFAFSAIAVPQLALEDNIIASSGELAWFASVFSLTSIIGCLLCGIMIDKYGRKFVLIINLLPYVVGWLYTGFSTTVMDLIISRAITGVAFGMGIPPIRVYCSEMAMPYMRGVIGSLVLIMSSIGIAIQAVMDAQMYWRHICFCNAAYAAVIMISNLYLPESPFYLLMKYDNSVEVRNSLKQFRANDYNVNSEIEDMEEYKSLNHICKLKFKGVCKSLFSASSCRPLTIILLYVIIFQLGGVSIVWLWTVEMLNDSKSSVDPNLGNIILSVIRCLTAIVTAILIYTSGRRPIAIISATLMGLASLTLALHVLLTHTPTVLPVICLAIYVIGSMLGYYTLPMLIMSEIYPLQIRGLLCGITVAFSNLVIFSVNRTYPLMRDRVGYVGLIFAFAIFCLLGTIYLYFCLPETKDLTLEEIEEFYNERRPTLVSSRAILSSQMIVGRRTSSLMRGRKSARL